MVPVRIDYYDGQFSMTRTDEGQHGWTPNTTVPLPLWQAWEDFQRQARVWHRIIGEMDNESYKTKLNKP